MKMAVVYELVAYQNVHHFNLGKKEFVYVNLIVGHVGQDDLIEFNHEIFTANEWQWILQTKRVIKKENVPLNIMIGDYYK